MTNINKISMGRLTTFGLLGAALVLAATLPYVPVARAGDIDCPPNITTSTNANINVVGDCVIGNDAGDRQNGNVKLEDDTDTVNFDAGRLNGNIECKGAGGADDTFAVAVGSGTKMNGDVKAEDCDPVIIGGGDAVTPGAVIRSNIEVKNGDLTINANSGGGTPATIFGNVKVENGTCTIAADAVIKGNREGTCA